MVKVMRCDKCNKEIDWKEKIECTLELFDGSLSIDNIDLCSSCWDNLQKTLSQFGKETKE